MIFVVIFIGLPTCGAFLLDVVILARSSKRIAALPAFSLTILPAFLLNGSELATQLGAQFAVASIVLVANWRLRYGRFDGPQA
jgi:hypothetical protein